MERAFEWIKRHRGLVAAIAAICVALKAVRWVAGGAWTAREWIQWDDVWPWLRAHWLVGLLVAVALFAVTFATVRALIAIVDRRRRAPQTATPPPTPTAAPPRAPELVPGDPLRDG